MEIVDLEQKIPEEQHVDDEADGYRLESEEDADDEDEEKVDKTKKKRRLPRKAHYDSVFTLCKKIDAVHQPDGHALSCHATRKQHCHHRALS